MSTKHQQLNFINLGIKNFKFHDYDSKYTKQKER